MTAVVRFKCNGPCGKNRQGKYFANPNHPKRVCTYCKRARSRASARKAHLLKTYGITQEQFDAMFKAQGGRCAICRGKRPYLLPVDHDHKTGFTRGLLCKLCNGRLLPSSRDNPQVLTNAAAYLLNPPAFKVIGKIVVPERVK